MMTLRHGLCSFTRCANPSEAINRHKEGPRKIRASRQPMSNRGCRRMDDEIMILRLMALARKRWPDELGARPKLKIVGGTDITKAMPQVRCRPSVRLKTYRRAKETQR